jgi:hypothetical protein
MELLFGGGLLMIPLVACSFALMVFAIERAVSLRTRLYRPFLSNGLLVGFRLVNLIGPRRRLPAQRIPVLLLAALRRRSAGGVVRRLRLSRL